MVRPPELDDLYPPEDYPGDPPARTGYDGTALTTGIVLGLTIAALAVAVLARLP